ncbi:MAG: polyphosphate polymerase domain-containing protein [Pseudomonadota bacterium]|nr:polyphosphate polymerase domain-containing protein [Pseudomonadota bacterium]
MRIATRYEVKYRISPELAEQVREWIARYMEPDAHGEGGSARYPVHSLYLDDADWRIYRETRNGNFSRFKLRARTYSFTPNAPVFLEVKSRNGEAMRKSRGEVDRAEAVRILDGGTPRNRGGGAIENFRTHMDRYRAYPRAWVTYERFAYVGGDRGLVRITFDSAIACAPPTRGLAEPERWYPIDDVKGIVVLELKYNGSYPAWVADTIRRFGLERRSMSKYRHAVEVLQGMESTTLAAELASGSRMAR